MNEAEMNEATKRKTPAQKKALDAYLLALRMEDNYLGSVFVTPAGTKIARDRTEAAHAAALKTGLTAQDIDKAY